MNDNILQEPEMEQLSAQAKSTIEEKLLPRDDRIPNTPIVLHGASTVIPELLETCNKYGANIPGAKGVPDEILHEASVSGVSKINVDTDLRLGMTATIRKVFAEEPSAFDPRKYLGAARDTIKEIVYHKMTEVFGSNNKA